MIEFLTDINKSVEVLQTGGIILYPTDTIWGIGADATNEQAVAKVYALKQREETKSMIILLADIACIKNYSTEPSQIIIDIINSDIPTTIIYPQAKNLAKNLINADGTIAIRIAKDIFCKALINGFGKPIISTSANLSGQNSPAIFSQINTSIKQGVDYVVTHRQAENIAAKPSSILKWDGGDLITMIR